MMKVGDTVFICSNICPYYVTVDSVTLIPNDTCLVTNQGLFKWDNDHGISHNGILFISQREAMEYSKSCVEDAIKNKQNAIKSFENEIQILNDRLNVLDNELARQIY